MKLGVNIDHSATVREARYRGRGFGEPDPVHIARLCEAAGAQGITAHLREDRRHIQDRDIYRLREQVETRFNFEMANTDEMVGIALEVKPDIVCLVPEKREEVTTEGGLDVVGAEESIRDNTKRLMDAGIEVSLFIDPDPAQIEASKRTGAGFIELHTGAFAEYFHKHGEADGEIRRLTEASKLAHGLGLEVNAGHGLNYMNLEALKQVPHLVELNIGHSIISHAISVGITRAVREMLALMENYDPRNGH